MTPHQLGLELRQLVLRQRLEGRGLDTRRLQAAIGDLCGAEHSDLAAPLRYLMLSAAFASAAGQDPPLADPRLLGRLQQELAQMYAERLCQRLQPVLEGLLGMASAPPAVPAPPPLTAPSPAWAVMPTAGQPGVPLAAVPVAAPGASPGLPAPRHGAASPLTVLLAFISGMLLMALAGIGLFLQQRSQPATGSRPLPQTGATGNPAGQPAPVASTAPAEKPQAEPDAAQPEPGSPAAETDASPTAAGPEALDRSLASVKALYEALSAKDYGRARSLFGGGAADQFDPTFFDQFTRVTVQELRLVDQSGSNVNLEGVVSFVYPDGTVQTETRTFTLDSSSDPPLITASAFGRVIKPR